MKAKQTLGVAFILAGMSLIAWVSAAGWKNSQIELRRGYSPPTPLWQAEPIVPTAPFLTPTLQETRPPQAEALLPSLSTAPANALERFGVGVPNPPLLKIEVAEKLGLGWYLAWKTLEKPQKPEGVEFWQMIRVHEEGFRPNQAAIHKVAQANPGATWLIGNEPDVIWQDNVTPARYAEWYHELYYLLKEADPTCQVAIGGVTQPTPLRLQYLEMVLSFYQTRYGEVMPVDIWNIHNFILREERGSWGVDIPPGLTVNQGILYELDDHDDLEVFKAQIINFRQWLADRGQRDKPLIVSEFGILMPKDYGFGPERVQRFLYGTYEFMLIATDQQIGYPADDNRLVQRWAWYSLGDRRYPTGNLIDYATGDLTSLGHAHQKFISSLPSH
ncbi:MAG: hypothetical protein HYR94_07665 [Chloroflexi bacterium]|nr:hypothetical protein [Chloroflexota bacterium]